MGLIPATKIDKLPVGDGVMMRGEITAGEPLALDRFVRAFMSFIVGWRDLAAKDQTEIDFTEGVTIQDVALRADQPKRKIRDYSIGIDMTNVSMEDRNKLFVMSQDKSKVIHISVTQVARRRLTVETPAEETKADSTETADGSSETSAPAAETPPTTEGLTPIDHSGGKLDLPTFAADSLEERFQLALLCREGASERWAGRIKTGLTDRDLIKAITSEWAGDLYEAPDGGLHFIVQGGNHPKFRLAPKAGVHAQINGKPTLEGKKLLDKAREVLGLEMPVGKHRGHATAVAAA